MSEHEFDYQIPIEDTDTYQMVYHANYLRIFERARCNFFGFDKIKKLKENGLKLVEKSYDQLKYNKSAVLGQLVKVSTTITSVTDTTVKFYHRLFELGGTTSLMDAVVEINVRNEKLEIVSFPDYFFDYQAFDLPMFTGSIPNPPVPPAPGKEPPAIYPITIYPDRLNSDGLFTTREALCFFDQARTKVIGGAEVLHKMQAEDKLLVVVAKIQKIEWNYNVKPVEAFEELEVRTDTSHSRGNPIVRFYQSIWRHGDSEPIVTAVVINPCISEDTKQFAAMPWLITNSGLQK